MKHFICALLLFTLTITLEAQQKVAPQRRTQQRPAAVPASAGGFYGDLFGAYSFVVQEPSATDPTTSVSGRNDFNISRASIGYRHNFMKFVSASIAYDAAADDLLEGFVSVDNIVPMVGVSMGLMQTPASPTVQKIWGYRSLGPSVLNRFGYVKEYDLGASVSMRMNPQGTAYASIMFGNGAKAAFTPAGDIDDKDKKVYFNAGNWFDRSNVVELYVDFENVGQGRSAVTGKLMYGLTMRQAALGVEAFYRMNRKFAINGGDITPAGGSLFTWFSMDVNLKGLLRVDFVDDDMNVSNAGFRTLSVDAGMDYMPYASGVHLIPNIEYVKLMKKGGVVPEPVDYITVRLTAAVSFTTL